MEVVKKIEMVVEKYLSNCDGHAIEDEIIIKYCADSTNITKNTKKITNFAFTIINDTKRAASVNGNYIIGKFLSHFNIFLIKNRIGFSG